MPRTILSITVVVLLALLAGAHVASGQDEGRLRDRIDRAEGRERSLSSAAERLRRLERATARDVAVLQERLADVAAELQRSETRLRRAEVTLDEQRARLARTRERLTEARTLLATVLRGRYEMRKPNAMQVVLDADDFADLVSRMEFLRRVAERDAEILRVVRRARDDAERRTDGLRPLVRKRREATTAARRQRDAVARMETALRARQATLARARAARLAALEATRAGRRDAQRTLTRLLAERTRLARSRGPGGPWAIPWPVVECESGGQNLPPNSAGASGYYQFMPATWQALGGSTPHAYLAPKAEQDRLAAQLWAGGKGAHNWVCAGLVGIG